MSDARMKLFETRPEEHFQLRCVRRAHSMQELKAIPGAKVVLTGISGLTAGFGRDLFLQWASNPKNTVMFTARPPAGTFGRSLYDNTGPRKVTLHHSYRVHLQGAEREAYRQEQRRKREEEEAASRAEVAEAMQGMSESESEDEGATVKHDIMAAASARGRKGFFKEAKTFPMYPHTDERVSGLGRFHALSLLAEYNNA